MSASYSICQLTHNSSGMSSSIWILDSGASRHMSPDSSYFASMSLSSSIPVMTVDGTPMPLACVGYVVTPNLSLSHVYHISKLTLNLASSSVNLITFSFFFLLCEGSAISKVD